MACRLFGAKPLSEPMLGYSQLDQQGQSYNQNINIFIHENASENIVFETTAILFRERGVKGKQR